MNILRPSALAAALAVGLGVLASPVLAQQNPGYFIPPAGGTQPARPAERSRPAQRPQPQPAPQPAPALIAPPGSALMQQQESQQQPEPEPPPINVTLPPVPDLPALPRGASPPAAVVGVLGIPDIMRASLAAQQIEKVVTERRSKLNEDAQKEQAAWRDMQQSLASQRANLSAEQIRTKERELQERITNAQKTFRDRNRVIQEAGQYGLAQIERMLIAVIRQVAESRGMNLVLHRAQVALNVNEFDITQAVVDQLNKVLPTVVLPPDGVSPATFAPAQAAAPAASPQATPASAAPAATPPAAPKK
jgi:Skp family chaperone for outer membrane proteins